MVRKSLGLGSDGSRDFFFTIKSLQLFREKNDTNQQISVVFF